jgi:hypothetical protein
MSVVGELLVLISKICVTYICGRRTLTFNNNSDMKTKGSPTTYIGDADFRY